MEPDFDPTAPLTREGPPLMPQQLADILNGKPNSNRRAVDKALKSGAIPGAFKIGARWFIPRPVVWAMLNGQSLEERGVA